MSDLRKAAEMALKALDALYINDYGGYEISKHERHIVDDAQEALSKALARPERKWVRLTESEIEQIECLWEASSKWSSFKDAALEIENRLKEKNDV